MIPLLQTTACENVGNSVVNSFTCIGDYMFWGDANMLTIFFVVLLSYIGIAMKVPVSTMFAFSWSMLFVIYWVFNVPVLVPIIVLGILFVGIQLASAIYKGPKDATQ